MYVSILVWRLSVVRRLSSADSAESVYKLSALFAAQLLLLPKGWQFGLALGLVYIMASGVSVTAYKPLSIFFSFFFLAGHNCAN